MFFRSRLNFALLLFASVGLFTAEAATEQSGPSGSDPQQETAGNPRDLNSVIALLKIRSKLRVAHDANGVTFIAPVSGRYMQDPLKLGQDLLPLGNPRKLSPLDEAYLDAFSILSSGNECSRWYGGPPATEVLNEFKQRIMLSRFDRQIAFQMTGTYMLFISAQTKITYRIFPRNEVNLEGAFYHRNGFVSEARVKPIGVFSPSTREARMLILLHELGHLIKKDDGDWLLPDDGHNSELSDKNTEQVLSSCGAQIRNTVRVSFVHEWETIGKSRTLQVAAN